MRSGSRPAKAYPDAGGTGAEAASDSVPIARQRRRAGAGVDGGPGAEDVATLYYVGDDGKLAALRARKGITDGQYTELMGPNVAEGMQVITAVTAGSGDASSAAVNPFQPAQDGGGGRGPGGGPRF
jgi:hypothetical protein